MIMSRGQVTEDFLRHLDDKQPDDGGGDRSGDPRGESHENYEEDADIPFISAEELVS